MRVAVTGAAGFIGRNLIPALKEAGHDVIAIGREAVGLKPLAETGVNCEATDYSVEGLGRILNGVDSVIHLAGRRSERSDTPLSFEAFTHPNISVLDNLLQAASASGVDHLIFASTIAVYSPENALPYREDERVFGLNPYGLSKVTGEGLLDLWARSGKMRATSLRLAAGFGHGERSSAVLMRFIDQATRGEPLIVRGNRNIGVDQLYIRDTVGAFMAALDSNASQGSFNIGAGRAYTLGEMATAVDAAFGGGPGVIFEDKPEAGAPAPYMSIEAAAAGLGWRPKWPLRTALADFHDTWRATVTPNERGPR